VNLLTIQVKDVKSYEGEGTMVIAPIGCYKFATHETHVRIEGEVLWSFARDGVSARASYCGPANETIEIRDCGRLSAWCR
jgi:hypothetical protein